MRPPSSAHADANAKKVNTSVTSTKKEAPVQGVFVVRKEKRSHTAVFVPVQTGITGATDIEVTGGLKAGDEIVIGPYHVLRDLKSGAQIKQDNTPPTSSDGTGDNGAST